MAEERKKRPVSPVKKRRKLTGERRERKDGEKEIDLRSERETSEVHHRSLLCLSLHEGFSWDGSFDLSLNTPLHTHTHVLLGCTYTWERHS